MSKAEKEVIKVEQQYRDGAITNGERYNKVIAIWSDVTEKVAKEMFKAMEIRKRKAMINPIFSWRTLARAVRRSRFVSSPVCAD